MKPARWTRRLGGIGLLGMLATWVAATLMYSSGHHPALGMALAAGCSAVAVIVAITSEARPRGKGGRKP